MQPWPTAYTFLHRQGQAPMRVIITRAKPAGHVLWDKPDAPPLGAGNVFPMPEAPLTLSVIAGANTVVSIEELQPAGKKRMSAADFLRGHPLKEGDRFGPEQP
jgi:methionyl-tRNA formyltransferase